MNWINDLRAAMRAAIEMWNARRYWRQRGFRVDEGAF